MSLRLGIFLIRAATVAGLGNSIFPVPPKNFTRSLGMSTITSSWGSILSFSHPSCYPASQHKYPGALQLEMVVVTHQGVTVQRPHTFSRSSIPIPPSFAVQSEAPQLPKRWPLLRQFDRSR